LLLSGDVYVGTKSSIPATTDYPEGAIVINSARAFGDPLLWNLVGTTWVPLGGSVNFTTTEIEDITNAVNTSDKYEGKQIFNETTNKALFAAGSTAGNVWRDAVGVTQHTPA